MSTVIGDLFSVAEEVIHLVKSLQIEEAVRRAAEAGRDYRTLQLKGRAATVHEVTLSLARLCKQRDEVQAMLVHVPEAKRPLAQIQLDAVCRDLFDPHILALRSDRRRFSRPVGR